MNCRHVRDEYYRYVCDVLLGLQVLILINLSQEFIIQCDASNSGIGGAFLQKENGVNHPILYASRKLLPREQKYARVSICYRTTLLTSKHHKLTPFMSQRLCPANLVNIDLLVNSCCYDCMASYYRN